MDEHAYMLWRRVFRDGPFTYDEFIAHPVFERALLNRAFVTTLLSEIYGLSRPLLDHVSIESLRDLVRAAAAVGDINTKSMNAKDDSAIFLHLSGAELWTFLTSKPWWNEDTPRHRHWIEDTVHSLKRRDGYPYMSVYPMMSISTATLFTLDLKPYAESHGWTVPSQSAAVPQMTILQPDPHATD